MRIRQRRQKMNENGVVSIELALILPILLLLVFGVIQFGRAYNAKIELSSAVREGARAFALGTGDPEAVTKDAAPGLDADLIEVDPATPATPCTSGEPATVTATYPFDLNVPFWGDHAITITATGVMRCNG